MLLTEKDYCDNQTSNELEKLGYPRYHYDATEVDKIFRIIPLYAAQKWLREEKGIIILVHHLITEEGDWEWEISYRYRSKDMYHSYEEALSEGIKESVKILKEDR